MAVLHAFVGSMTVSGEAAPALISSPAPSSFLSTPNQNHHAAQASVCCVPFESKRQPGSTFWNPQHRTELIVNLKQPHKSQLFSVRLWSRSVICKVQCESNTRKLLLYHLRKRIHVMNKVKRVRWSYVYCTLDINAPWFGNSDKSIISIWKEDLQYWQHQLFQYLAKFWCGILMLSANPKFSGWKKLWKLAKTSKRCSGCVGHADFGKLELNNIRKDNGNSQGLSMVSAIN